MKDVNLYIDTSVKGPKRKDGSYIYMLDCKKADGSPYQKKEICFIPNSTENILTLEAMAAALGRITLPCRLHIYLECRYVANAFKNGWLDNWSKSDWKNAKGRLVADVERWRDIQYLLNKHEFYIHLQERHEYRAWLRWELTKKGD